IATSMCKVKFSTTIWCAGGTSTCGDSFISEYPITCRKPRRRAAAFLIVRNPQKQLTFHCPGNTVRSGPHGFHVKSKLRLSRTENLRMPSVFLSHTRVARQRFVCMFLFLAFACRIAAAQKPELVVQSGHSGEVVGLAFSPDGKLLASGAR